MGLLLFWALLGSCMSMRLYSLLSPQKSLARLKQDTAAARKEMAGYDGEFGGLGKLAKRSLALSLKQVGLTLGPAVVGAMPVIFILVWLSNTFGLVLPENGLVKVTCFPKDEIIESMTAGYPGEEKGVWYVRWRSLEGRLHVVEAPGRIAASLEANAYTPQVHGRKWWNLFLGNPAGYIEDSSRLERMEFDFKRSEYLSLGPEWMRGWEVVFLGAAFIFSVLIKIIFKIQ